MTAHRCVNGVIVSSFDNEPVLYVEVKVAPTQKSLSSLTKVAPEKTHSYGRVRPTLVAENVEKVKKAARLLQLCSCAIMRNDRKVSDDRCRSFESLGRTLAGM